MSSARTHTYDGRRCTRQTRLRSVMPEVLCCISAVPVNATAITDQHTSRAYHSRSGAHSREILRLIEVTFEKVMIVVTAYPVCVFGPRFLVPPPMARPQGARPTICISVRV
jgi:hypothetical protein